MFKDVAGNIYRKRIVTSNSLYLRCRRRNCPLTAVYSFEKKTIKFKHNHCHASVGDENKIDNRLIELDQFIRNRARDPKFYQRSSIDLYDHCVAEFIDVSLPDGHKKNTLLTIFNIRKQMKTLVRMQKVQKTSQATKRKQNQNEDQNSKMPKKRLRSRQSKEILSDNIILYSDGCANTADLTPKSLSLKNNM